MNLRPYQELAVDSVLRAHVDHQSALLVLPTGCGKTVVFSHLAARQRKRTLILAHRQELVEQAAEKVRAVTGEHAAIEMGDRYSNEHGLHANAKVVVASVQTMIAGFSGKRRMDRFRPNEFGLVVVDEAHHSAANSYRAVIDYFTQYSGARVLGVTATPDRGDKKGLGSVFGTVAFQYEVADAITDGWLVPVTQQIVHVASLDFSEVRSRGGDFVDADLARVMNYEKTLHGVVSPAQELTAKLRTVVFATSVDHADRMAEMWNRYEPGCARSVSGRMNRDDRRQLLTAFARGDFRVLTSCMVLTEGWDCPAVEAIVMARPTKSRALYCLDSETEILTPYGWKGINDRFDKAYQYHVDSGSIDAGDVLARIDREMHGDERMMGISSPMLDIAVTNMHRMVHSVRVGRDKQHTGNIVGVAQDLPPEFRIPVCGIEDAVGVPLSDDELRFIGLWMTDGTTNKVNSAVTISQSMRHPECVSFIESALAGCGMRYGKHLTRRAGDATNLCVARHDAFAYTVSHGDARRKEERHLKGWSRLSAYMDKDLAEPLMEMDERQLLVLIEAMNVGDGAKYKSRSTDWDPRTLCICTSRKQLADRMQSLCVRRGIRCNIATEHRISQKTMYMMRIDPTRSCVSVSRTATDRQVWGDRPVESNRVWCIEVSTGAIICRRNGKAFVTGNCQMLGRGTRPLPGLVDGVAEAFDRRVRIEQSTKPELKVLDFTGNSAQHKLVCAIDILRPDASDEVRELAKRKASAGVRVDTAVDEAEEEERARREKARSEQEARRAALRARATYSVTKMNPFDVIGRAPPKATAFDRGREITEGMRNVLLKGGVDPEGMSYSEAKAMCAEVVRRWKLGLCSLKQARYLKDMGHSPDCTRDEARRILDSAWSKR